jgi:hypothetical protein
LIAPFHARSRRACASMAQRAAGARLRPSSARPASSVAPKASGRPGRVATSRGSESERGTRVGGGSARRSRRPSSRARRPPEIRPRRSFVRSLGRRSDAARSVRGRVSPDPSRAAFPGGDPGADAGCCDWRAMASTGLSTDRQTVRRKVDNSGREGRAGGRTRASGRAGGASNGPAERAPHDVDDLLDVSIGVAVLGSRPHAARDVVLQDEHRQ